MKPDQATTIVKPKQKTVAQPHQATASPSKPHRNIATPRKKLFTILATCIAIVIVVIGAIILFRDTRFELSNEYYGSSEIIPATADEIRTKISEHKSFTVFVSQPGCRTAEQMRDILQEFIDQRRLQIYELDFSALRDSGIADVVKYYPSFLIFREGELVDFLDANSDADADAFMSLPAFEKWYDQYILQRD